MSRIAKLTSSRRLGAFISFTSRAIACSSPAPRTIAALMLASLAVALPALSGCHSSSKPPTAAQSIASQQDLASQMVVLGAKDAENFLHHTQTVAIRNMLGGVRGVFLSPNISGGAAIVGYETGTGFLMRRHGKDWSDPVFFTLSGTSAGWQVGAKEERVLVLLMTDAAVDNFVRGNMELGGTGGFALGTWGAGGAGAGEVKGGLEELVLSTNEGAFVGGGWAGIQPKPATAINDDVYGPKANVKQILSVPGGRYAPAKAVRSKLTEMVVEAWADTPPTHADASSAGH
jgi:lipid-binding SYLF domain-containing protein